MEQPDHEFCDLTEEEEANLPLPDGWITLIKMTPAASGAEATTVRNYKNVRLGIESSEHPYILQAQNITKKFALPAEWALKTVTLQDGSKDVFYHNAELDFSMWDHPLLREQVCNILTKAGHNPVSFGIKRERKRRPKQEPPKAEPKAAPSNASHVTDDQQTNRSSLSLSISDRQSFKNDQASVRSGLLQQVQAGTLSVRSERSSDVISEMDRITDDEDENQSDLSHSVQTTPMSQKVSAEAVEQASKASGSMGKLYLDDLGDLGSNDVSSGMPNMTAYHDSEPSAEPTTAGTQELSPAGPETVESESVVDNRRDWEGLLNAYKDPGLEYVDKISHRIRHIKPPVTISGIRVLREDVMEANERVHQLIIKIRSLLSVKSGIDCSILYHDNNKMSPGGNQRSNVTLASDIVTALRQRPEYIVLAMANSNNVRDGSPIMVQVAFTALHRLLHPFSSDNSMTTAILLQGINYQLDELTAVEQVFSEVDSKLIIARALFVTDTDLVVRWDPLLQPLPTVPDVPSETVLACLLRVYAIRRDVTSYYRTIWKPVLPGVVALLKQHGSVATDHNQHNVKPLVFANIIAIANRLLECTLSEKSIMVFPAIATAVCRAVHEIGGHLAMHSYLFQLLILPNLLKVLAGDHESAENEDIYRVENVEEIVNKYYDSCFWFNKEGLGESAEATASREKEKIEAGILDPLRTLIWLIWRIYTCSVFLDDIAVTALTMQTFLTSTKPIALDESAYQYPPLRLRNMLRRLRRKIDKGCEFLLKMPMDAQGSEYLGVNEEEEGGALDHQIQRLDAPQELAHLLDRRLHTLHFKPNEMLNLTVASRYEVGALLNDIALAMEMHDQAAKNPLYQAIAEYLNQNMDYDTEEAHEQLMELTFLYVTDDFNGYGFDSSAGEQEEKGGASEGNELIATRYDQLLRGLRLSNRYEDSLIKMIARIQGNRISSLFELTEDETWFHAPEFDPAVRGDTVKIAKKHTAGSISKQKSALYGLARAANVPVFPLFSRDSSVDHHPNIKSLAALQKDIFNSYRFHTSAPCANAGTSLAGPKVLAPKIHPSSINVTTAEAKQTGITRNRTRYTKIEIKPNANILVPTQSFANHKLPLAENYQQKHSNFKKSLRDHDIIPTDEFQVRYRKRVLERRNRKRMLAEQALRSNADPSSGLRVSPSPPRGRNLKPFPEHLRYRMYGQQPAQQQRQDDGYWMGDDVGPARPRSSFDAAYRSGMTGGSPNGRLRQQGYFGGPSPDAFRGVDSPQSLAQEIIRDYGSIFTGPTSGGSVVSNSQRPAFMHAARESHHRPVSPASSTGVRRARSRSPGLPEPMPEFQTQFQSPTKSTLYRMTDNSEQKLRKSQELRSYERNTDFEAEQPFSPTANKIYPPQGLRVPRVPEFLQNFDIIEDHSRSVSRSTSRSLSRSNSFSGSPIRDRSRNNSFSDLSHVCKRVPSRDMAQEFPAYEPDRAAPISVPVPNTVSIDLTQLRDAERRNNTTQYGEENSYHSVHTGSSAGSPLVKLKKVNVSVEPPKLEPTTFSATAARPAMTSVQQPPAVPVPAGAPVVVISAPKRVLSVSSAPAPALSQPFAVVEPQQIPSAQSAPVAKHSINTARILETPLVRPLAAHPVTSRLSALSRPPVEPILETVAPVRAGSLYPSSSSDAPPAGVTSQPAPAAHVSVPVSVPAQLCPLDSKPDIPAPRPASSTSTKEPHEAAEFMGSCYSIKFQSRDAQAAEDTTVPGALPHVYDVNAAHEEAFLRAKNSIHIGASGDGEESDPEGGEDDKSLVYVTPSSGGRGLSSKQKSMTRRASKVMLDDDQVVGLLTAGFQAIKVSCRVTGSISAGHFILCLYINYHFYSTDEQAKQNQKL